MTQLALPLGHPPDPHDGEFLIGDSNRFAVRQLEHWRSWPVRTGLLIGPRRSGRTLLAGIFAASHDGEVIDDAEQVAEVELFHAWNRAQYEGKPLLIVASALPPVWPVQLPDLRSRLGASPVLRLGDPDDVLLPLLLQRHFERRLVLARPEAIAWLAARIERSHAMLEHVADAMEQAVSQRRDRWLTIPLARATLAAGTLSGEGATGENL